MTEDHARRMSFGNLDNLDELGSFNGSDSQNSPEQRNKQRMPIDYNPVGLTIGQISPGGRSTNSDFSVYSRNQSHSVHQSVHMHVQENAKIPNLNKPVDRTNSSRPSYSTTPLPAGSGEPSSPSGNTKLDEDFSMAELFLSKESKIRRSLDQNYSGLGALLNDVGLTGSTARRPSADGSSISAKSDSKQSVDETQMEIDALTAAIDPTPWSEIEQKIHKDEASRYGRSSQQQPSRQQQQAPVATSSHPHHYNYYPYGRQHQLPIPGKPSPSVAATATAPKPSPPPSSSSTAPMDTNGISMEQALATAAAIAASTHANTSTKVTPLVSASAPYTEAQQSTTVPSSSSTTSSRNYHRQRASYTPPMHAVAHTTNRGSVLAAASQKSQYGFGGNHTVPSVPAPPPGGKANKNIKRKSALPSVPSIPPPGSLPAIPNLHARPAAGPDAHTSAHHPANAGAAYERKKQRAKDARVKLNDAIEKLSVAMNFAGSQSKLRNKLLSTQIHMTDARSQSLQASDECVKMAEQAKKWDRPSFVGTAASLVQGLNTQCEALMNEISVLDQRIKSMEGDGNGVIQNGGDDDDMMDVAMSGGDDTNNHKHPLTSSSMNGGHSTKRIKQEDSNGIGAVHPPAGMGQQQQARVGINGTIIQHHVTASPDEKIVYKNIAKMLDPVTLCRCSCVSRKWRDMEEFQCDDIWLDLAVKRFGFYNVRQWTEKLEDDTDTTTVPTNNVNGNNIGGDSTAAAEVGDGDGSTTTTTTDTTQKFTKKKLYQAMNSANIMPHVQQESVSLLGDAKIPGRVSVWAFMVERSNGETLRSVMREPGTGPHGGGQYHSSPVVELRFVIQNTGTASYPIVLKKQSISVDVSTRRTGGELKEISWDDRFAKIVRNLDGTIRESPTADSAVAAIKYHEIEDELCRLSLFDSIILEVHINARGCSTTSKFQQRSNFTKLLVFFDGTTVPMVIPFLRDTAHH